MKASILTESPEVLAGLLERENNIGSRDWQGIVQHEDLPESNEFNKKSYKEVLAHLQGALYLEHSKCE
jgi:hypothetical protein